jgi:hypothetical protein
MAPSNDFDALLFWLMLRQQRLAAEISSQDSEADVVIALKDLR